MISLEDLLLKKKKMMMMMMMMKKKKKNELIQEERCGTLLILDKALLWFGGSAKCHSISGSWKHPHVRGRIPRLTTRRGQAAWPMAPRCHRPQAAEELEN